jgi:hypothetical protein
MKNGYDKVEWGTKLEEVEKIYGKLTRVGLFEDEKGLIYYYQEKPEQYITSRRFGFGDDELQSVSLEIDKFTDEVIEKMEGKFGEFTITAQIEGHVLGPEHAFINYVSDDLRIEMYTSVKWDHLGINIYYFNPQWEVKYSEQQRNLENVEKERRISEANKISL